MTLNPFKFSYPGPARFVLWTLLTLTHITTTLAAIVNLTSTPLQILSAVSAALVLFAVAIGSSDYGVDVRGSLKIWAVMLIIHWSVVGTCFAILSFTPWQWVILLASAAITTLIGCVVAGYFETRRKTIEEVTEKFS